MALDSHDDDLSDVVRVDDLLDAIGRGERPTSAHAVEDELFGMLADWREELSAGPVPQGPSAADIAAVYGGATVTDLEAARSRRPARNRRRMTTFIGAAAAVVAVVGSISVASFVLRPGNSSWDMNPHVFNEKNQDVELVAALEAELKEARDALDIGDVERASALLAQVSQRLDGVQSAADRVKLIRVRDQIERDIQRAGVNSPELPPEPVPTEQPDAELMLKPAPKTEVPEPPVQQPQPEPPLQPAPEAPPAPHVAPVPPPTALPTVVLPSKSPSPVSPLNPSALQRGEITMNKPAPTTSTGR